MCRMVSIGGLLIFFQKQVTKLQLFEIYLFNMNIVHEYTQKEKGKEKQKK